MTHIRDDLRIAVRALRRSPGFTLLAIGTLAIGIGATTSVFSVVNAVLLRPVHVSSPESVVRFLVSTGATSSVAGVPQLVAWRQRTDAFQDVAAHRMEYANATLGAEPQQVPIARITREFFQLFNAPLEAGRFFTADEDRAGGPSVAVLSHDFSTRTFGDSRGVVGRSIQLGNVPHIIVGILAPGFDTEQFDVEPAAWVPFQIDPDRVDAGNLFTVTGRLRSGWTLSDGNAALGVAVAAYRRDRPGAVNARTTWAVQPLSDAMVGTARPSLAVLLGAVGFLLLIACANVANLLLVRADVRAREVAIRRALGASRARVLIQTLTESLLLAVAGGAVGLGAGIVGVRALLALYPSTNPYRLGDPGATIPRIGQAGAAVTVDGRVFVFAVVVCLSTGILFGLWPGVMLGRVDVAAAMKRVTGGFGLRHTRGRAALVVGEVALALMLLVAATLLIRTSLALRAVDAGFQPANVITTRTSVTATRYETREGLTELTRIGAEQIRSLPGVLSVSAGCCMPLETVWQLPFVVEGRPPESLTRSGALSYSGFAGWTFVAPGYFDVLRIPILRGRDFSTVDTAGAPGVVLINEEMARRFWPGRDPLGDRLIVGRGMRPEYSEEPIRQIVGIVGNVRDTDLTRNARPGMYVPLAQEPDGVTRLNVRLLPLVWLVRTAADQAVARTAIERSLGRVSGLAAARTRSMTEVMLESTARAQFNTWLMSIFGGCALLLSSVGIYGLMAYSVQQRTREIGVRMALGAKRADVRRMVVRDGLVVTAVGIAVGLAASLGLSRFLSTLLFHVSPYDRLVFVSVPVLLFVSALVGIAIPCHRATHVSPIDAIRAE